MTQTGNEKTSLSTNAVVMFYSCTVLQATAALCCSPVCHETQGTEAKQPGPVLSQLPFELHTECLCRFDPVVGMMILSRTGLCPEHTRQRDQRDAEIITSCQWRRQNPKPQHPKCLDRD